MKKTHFIDRDGTILAEPADEQIDSFDKFMFVPKAITALAKIAQETDFDLVMVTNQDGLGTASFPEETFWPVQNKMLKILEGVGVRFSEILIDRTFESENAPTRKPGTAMLTKYLAQGIDLDNSYVIGDRLSDIRLAENLGCKSIYLSNNIPNDAVFQTTDWDEIYNYLKALPRMATTTRKTKETDITITLNLDGNGKSDINTGLGFFDHMLEQLPHHGGFDLTIKAVGDLNVDPHHLMEDTGIVLGETFLKAIGKKKGIERYGFTLPMDDCLSQVAIDFGGRPWLVWDVAFDAPYVGEVPTEMFFHFFKSFSDSAKCNLNIKSEGDNNHHKIESIYKAFARATKKALAKTNGSQIPSSKGTL